MKGVPTGSLISLCIAKCESHKSNLYHCLLLRAVPEHAMLQLLSLQLLALAFFCAACCAQVENFEKFRLGKQFDIIDIYPMQEELEERSVSGGLLEFTPIKSTIVQSDIQYYSFSLNTSTGLGEHYQYLIFISGNICLQPDDLSASANMSLTVYYSFNELMFQDNEIGLMVQYQNGYFQTLADVPALLLQESILYIAVRAPESTNTTATWTYQIGASQNDLVFQWDNRLFASVVDTDHESALVMTGNMTSSGDALSLYNSSLSNYQLYVFSYEYKSHFQTLNNSWCAVRNGPALFSTSSFDTSYTTLGGGLHQQFYVTGLNSSTRYVAFLLEDFGGSSYGGTLYKQFEFETLSTDACSLIFDLDFCDEVAYSVPALENLDKAALKSLYDDQARSLYTNFSKALQQIPCNTSAESIFLPIRTCTDCANLYKNWLCSVTIPRCSSRNITGYLYRDINESRSDFVNEQVAPYMPYFEILPCVNVCECMVRDCPADFGFVCPKRNDSIRLSYYWDDGGEYDTCNFVGRVVTVKSGARWLGAALWMSTVAFVVVMLLC